MGPGDTSELHEAWAGVGVASVVRTKLSDQQLSAHSAPDSKKVHFQQVGAIRRLQAGTRGDEMCVR